MKSRALKTIIIEDEKRARVLLHAMLQQECPTVEVIGEAEDLPGGIKLIHKLKPDLVLLDIEMPVHSGLEILDFFDEDDIQFQIIFTTAYSDYAVKAFQVNAVDYLLKPLEATALKSAIERAKKRQQLHTNFHYDGLRKSLLGTNHTRIGIPDSNGIVFVEIAELVYLDASGAYTHVYLSNQRKITTSKKLKYFEERLADMPQFMRIHRSHIVNLQHVIKFTRTEGGEVLLSSGTLLPVSRDKANELIAQMGGV